MISLSNQSTTGTAVPPGVAFLSLSQRGIVSQVTPLDHDARRELTKGIARRVHGVFASIKLGRSVPWRTRDQRDLMCLLEVDPDVLSYEDSPEQVSFVLDGRQRTHVPAFRVQMRRGTAILDVSSASGRTSDVLAGVYAERGVPYRSLRGKDIRLEPRFGNASWILARRAHQPSQEAVLLVVGALSAREKWTVAELEAELPQVRHVASVVCAMAIRCLLALDLSAPEPLGMPVSLSARGVLR